MRPIVPRTMRSIVPTAGNMLIGTLKGTSIVSVLAVHDLLYSVQLVDNQTYQVIPLLLVATLWYIAVTTLLGAGQFHVERHYARGSALGGGAARGGHLVTSVTSERKGPGVRRASTVRGA